jgi:PAS domain S-box-containing protein
VDDPRLDAVFVRLAERHPHAIVLVELGPDGQLALRWANPAALTRFGDATLRALLGSTAHAPWQRACRQALATARALEVELPGVAHASYQVALVPLDATLVSLDIHAGALTREREARLEQLFSQNVHGVFFMEVAEPFRWDATCDQEAMLDHAFAQLRVVAANDAMCLQMETSRERLLGSGPRDRWAGNATQWREHMRQLYTQGQVHHTVRAPRDDGTWFDAEGEYACTYDAEGRITGHSGMQRDVSSKREVVAELASSRDRLELAILGADIGIWDVDVVGQRVLFDHRWLHRFGYADPEQWHAWTWWLSVMHPEDVPETQRAFVDHLAGKTPLLRAEYRMRMATGTWAWVLSTGRVTGRDPAGNPSRLVGICVDVTERKQLQARLAASERLASLGTLAAGVGHEINNPLTYVVLNLALIERELTALERAGATGFDRIRGMLEQTRFGTDRVSTIVRDLLALARAPDDRPTAVDPVAVIERCLQMSEHQVAHRARVICELHPVPPVCSTEGRMIQLFLNLIVNAAQAIPEGDAGHHWIRVVSSTSPEGRAVIEVSDNGSGIGAKHVDRIFEPFFTTKPVGEGTGLGLTICRSIVTGLGGELEVESTPGQGTTFRVSLPPADLASTGAAAPATRIPDVVGLRILVIDDEPIVGKLLESILDQHVVSAETSGRVALDRLRRGERFDRILCDLMMPDLSGMEFYDQLGKIDPAQQARVVFLTGGAFTERARSFLERVPNRRLHKPFEVEQLVAVLTG